MLPLNLDKARYVSLSTYRRDGREVMTPVWIASQGARHFIFSAPHAGKVKRIRANPRVRLAHCNAWGKLRSAWLVARAQIVADEATAKIAYRALRKKYGFALWIADCMSKLTGRYDKRVLIEVNLPPES